MAELRIGPGTFRTAGNRVSTSRIQGLSNNPNPRLSQSNFSYSYLFLLRWAGHVARMEEGRSAFKILTGKPTGKRPLGSPWRRWEDNI